MLKNHKTVQIKNILLLIVTLRDFIDLKAIVEVHSTCALGLYNINNWTYMNRTIVLYVHYTWIRGTETRLISTLLSVDNARGLVFVRFSREKRVPVSTKQAGNPRSNVNLLNIQYLLIQYFYNFEIKFKYDFCTPESYKFSYFQK